MNLDPHFERLARRLAEVETALSDGSIFADPARAQDLTREHSRLKQALATHAAWKHAIAARESNAALLADPATDPELHELATQEQADLDQRLPALELACRAAILPPDENAGRNVILEIRPGTGGSEAALFVADLLRMYSRYIERMPGWKLEVLECSPGDLGGIRDVVFQVSGEDAFARLQFEGGVHRVQRVPATEAQGRIHTSTATVAVLPEAREVDVEIKPDDLRIDVCRSGGPGGQGVNTTDSAVQITHLPTGLIVRCQDGRSQIKNRERAMSILRSRLLEQRQREEQAAYAAQRKSQVGTGDRNEKIRTYNYPQNRVTDHRINLTLYDLAGVMEGAIDSLLDALARHDIESRLASLQDA
jgi:peptide chain release factor 1